MPIASARAIGHCAICSQCGCEIGADPASYPLVIRAAGAPMQVLIQQTAHADLEQQAGAAAQLRHSLINGGGPEARVEQFVKIILARPFEEWRRGYQTHIDRVIAASMIFGAASGIWAIFEFMRNNPQPFRMWLSGITAAVGFMFFVWAMMTDDRRYFRRKVEPAYKRTLSDFQPTASELVSARSIAMNRGFRLAKCLVPRRIIANADAAQPSV